MKTISVKISPELGRWLDKKSKQLGRSKSAIARDALDKFLSHKIGPSCDDSMSDACGSLRSGVSDLATNKKNVKGFGKKKR